MTEIEYLSKFVNDKNKKFFDGLVTIANNRSPSSAFKRASWLAQINGKDKFEAIGIAKATRKLAIIKRDQSQTDFDNAVTAIRSISYGSAPSKRSGKKIPMKNQIISDYTNADDLFAFGNYGWLGEYRKKSILKKLDNSWAGSNLPLDVFHSCYLLNKKQSREMTDREQKILKPILDDNDLMVTTVGNDILSRLYAVKYVQAIESEIDKEMERQSNSKEYEEGRSEGLELDDKLEQIADRAHKIAKNRTEETRKVMDAFGEMAGDKKDEIFYESEIELNKHLDMDELLKRLRSFDLIIKESEEDILGIPSGVTFGSEINKVISSELALPDDIFYYKYATNSLLVNESKAEKKMEPLLILIDKSGSMSDRERMTFSRTVAFLIANKAINEGSDVLLQFFDVDLYPDDSISLKENKVEFMRTLLSIKNDGGTDIQGALETIKNKDLRKVVLITDGDDSVDEKSKPPFPLISVLVGSDNLDLKRISNKAFTLDDDMSEIVLS
jgi:uncharacterized protein with von Willebrand factor type A (vWA) domain